jgi:hypothetical protein
MALVNKIFSNCFTGGGPAINKTFEIESTGGWTNNLSYIIYSGDGGCYYYSGTDSLGTPITTYLAPTGTNAGGACNSSTGCPSVNLDVYPNNVYYTFSSCCTSSIISFRRGDIEIGSDYVNGTTMWLSYGGSGGSFSGCYTVLTGILEVQFILIPPPLFHIQLGLLIVQIV